MSPLMFQRTLLGAEESPPTLQAPIARNRAPDVTPRCSTPKAYRQNMFKGFAIPDKEKIPPAEQERRLPSRPGFIQGHPICALAGTSKPQDNARLGDLP